jgi:ATP-dependent exoDNAse (exonuclease V) alpha subunit
LAVETIKNIFGYILESIDINDEFKQAIDLLENTNKNVFITGRAGTGKSTLLNYFCKYTNKKFVVLAPTGVAALNVGGQTIHSFFGFKPNVTMSDITEIYFDDDKNNIYKLIDILIIDEISMVRADLLDCIDAFLRTNGPSKDRAFGGVQVAFIGDLYQLPPVIRGEEKDIIKGIYKSPYFYSAKVFDDLKMEFIELTKIYRQSDVAFIELLNAIRNNTATDNDLEFLNKRVKSIDIIDSNEDLYVYLATTNKVATKINSEMLAAIKRKIHSFKGTIEGNFDEKNLPTSIDLQLKVGSQVMMVNNDVFGGWVNGSLGNINAFKNDERGNQYIIVNLGNNKLINVYPNTWNIYHYFAEKGVIKSDIIGKFTQYPLILAWAITIHKSQGKTFDRVIIDIGSGAFACGQVYVALSRCTSLDGIILKKAISKKHIWTDYRVVHFLTKYQYKITEKKLPYAQKIEIINRAIEKNILLEIVYLKPDDKKSRRIIKPLAITEMVYCGKKYMGFQAFCTLRNENRIFRLERILEIKELVDIIK